jgi:hypothetical protein
MNRPIILEIRCEEALAGRHPPPEDFGTELE